MLSIHMSNFLRQAIVDWIGTSSMIRATSVPSDISSKTDCNFVMTIIDKEIVGENSLTGLSVPDVPLGIFLENSFRENIANHGDRPWLTDASTGKSTYSFSQMVNKMRSVASGLRKRGYVTGDNVVFIASNHTELPLLWLGAWRAGGTVAGLGFDLSSDVMEMRLRELKPKFILTDLKRASLVVETVRRLDFVKEVFVIGNEIVEGCSSFDQLLHDQGDECPEFLDDIDGDSTAWFMHSSGTTGVPKCIVLTQETTIKWFVNFRDVACIKGAKYLFVDQMVLPTAYEIILGFSLAYVSIYYLSDFSEDNLMAAIDRFKPAWVKLFPHHIAWLCRCPYLDKYDLTSVKVISTTGFQVYPVFEKEIFDRFPNLLLFNNMYGMNEVGEISEIRPKSLSELEGLDRAEVISRHPFGSIGKINPYCKIKIVDFNSGRKLGHNEAGEICVKTPFLLKEYLDNPKETNLFIRNGWAHTGDQGYYDENENLFLVGREKELITYRYNWVLPFVIENHILSHPSVEDAGVIGIPNEMDDEHPLAFVVLSESGKHTTADEIIAYTNGRVKEEEKLRGGVRFVDKIPRNYMGKIARLELMKLLDI